MLDDDDYDDTQFLPLKYAWRELIVFILSMSVLIWILWQFVKYVWEYFLG
jgi:hypothetical protein